MTTLEQFAPAVPSLARAESLRIGLVAGETSGDQLGADLITSLRERFPAAEFFGMAGPRMLAAGCHALAHVDQLNVMGLVEIIRHYPRLRALRKSLAADILARSPHVVIGIDVPDFALWIEARAKASGALAVHYVCPQVWAWRPGRIPGIARAVDLILALFPFEVPFLQGHGISAVHVGHPLADRIPAAPDRSHYRALLGLPPNGPLVALMPGSRRQEVARLADLFLAAGLRLAARQPDIHFVLGAVGPDAAAFLEARRLAVAPQLAVSIVQRQATEALLAADAALVASGTVTLEAALCGTPSVVAYRLAPLSYWWLRRLVTVPHVALPNLLLDQRLFPEFLQEAATPDALAGALEHWLVDEAAHRACQTKLAGLHAQLVRQAGRRAAEAIEAALLARTP